MLNECVQTVFGWVQKWVVDVCALLGINIDFISRLRTNSGFVHGFSADGHTVHTPQFHSLITHFIDQISTYAPNPQTLSTITTTLLYLKTLLLCQSGLFEYNTHNGRVAGSVLR